MGRTPIGAGDDAGGASAASADPAGRLAILFEDARLLAVDKPAGLVAHPAYKHPDGTLADLVFARQAARGEARPWLLHRLDRETSGVVLFAKTEEARRSLVRQFERHAVRKRYLALVTGAPPEGAGEIDAPLRRDPADRRRTIVAPDGRPSRTRYRVLAARGGHALVLAEPVTGRTHQIRAHLASVGAPLVGDARYLPAGSEGPLPEGSPAAGAAPRAMLHAWRIDARSPGPGAPFAISAPPPGDFLAAAARLGLGSDLARYLNAREDAGPRAVQEEPRHPCN